MKQDSLMQNINLIKGEVTYVLRDAVTEEVISTHTQPNIVTEWMYNRLYAGGYLGDLVIALASRAMGQSRYAVGWPSTSADSASISAVGDTNIPSVGTGLEIFSAVTGANPKPLTVQLSTRFNPPVATRTWRSAGMLPSYSYNNGQVPAPWVLRSYFDPQYAGTYAGRNTQPFAYVKFQNPCTQTTIQVLDVYYRLQFPEDPDSGIPSWMYEDFVRRTFLAANVGGYSDSDWNSQRLVNRRYMLSAMYPIPIAKSKEANVTPASRVGWIESSVAVPYVGGQQTPGLYNNYHFSVLSTFYQVYQPYGVTELNPLELRELSYGLNYTHSPGLIMRSMVSGGTASYPGYGDRSYPYGFTNFSGVSKIQNVIGKGHQVPPTNDIYRSMWLDVDNLPPGGGKVSVTGDWLNKSTPAVPGLYAKSLFPELVRAVIVDPGRVDNSSATYKIVREKMLGFFNINNNTGTLTSSTVTVPYAIPALCSSMNGVIEANRCIIGDVNPSEFDTRQISGSTKYDDCSLIILKRSEVILYDITGGDYWKYPHPTGPGGCEFHQAAVVAGVIYVACLQTGLWKVDPRTETALTQVTPGAGLTLTSCYGVAKGYGDTLWAVGTNGIGKLESGSWLRYHAGSTPAFDTSLFGTLADVEYLKVDETSVDHQMVLVRRKTAATNGASFGVWWSLATAAALMPNDPAYGTGGALSGGRPRLSRALTVGKHGTWAIQFDSLRICNFGATSFITPAGVAAIGVNVRNVSYAVPQIRKDPSNQTIILSFTGVVQNVGIVAGRRIMDVWDTTGARPYAAVTTVMSDHNTTDTGSSGYANVSSGLEGGYGVADQQCMIWLDDSVFVRIAKRPPFSNGTYVYTTAIVTHVQCVTGDGTLSGGPLSWVYRSNYGWSGSAWVKDHVGTKPVHVASEALHDGMSIRFIDNPTGNSFREGNYWQWGVCEGLLKDNATQMTSKTTFYARRAYKNQTATSNLTVATSTVQNITGATGTVGLDSTRNFGSHFISGNHVYFEGANTRQTVVGNKRLIGDFDIDFDCSALNDPLLYNCVSFGVGTAQRTYGRPHVGFIYSRGSLYAIDRSGATPILVSGATSYTSTTSLKIKRIGSVIQLLRNGSVVYTATGLPLVEAREKVMDVIWTTWDDNNSTYCTDNMKAPGCTINANGTEPILFAGNPSALTGAFHSRFFALDDYSIGAFSGTLNGVAVVLKTDGTLPAPGEVAIDRFGGAFVFNAADLGKTFLPKYTYQQSS